MEYCFKIRKKGKTRGRRSKKEATLEAVSAYWYENHKRQLQKMYEDALIYGTGCSLARLKDLIKNE